MTTKVVSGRLTKYKGKTASVTPGTAVVYQLSGTLRAGVSIAALTAAMLVAPLLLPATFTGSAGAAWAADECGPGPVVTCLPADNPFSTGITYSGNNQTITLAPGVVVTNPGGSGIYVDGVENQTVDAAVGTITSAGQGISVSSYAAGNATATAGQITTSGDYAQGISVYSGAGNASATSQQITTSGYSAQGISVYSPAGNASVTSQQITTSGDYAQGIQAQAGSNGQATVTSGQITTSGNGARGIDVDVRGAYNLPSLVASTGKILTQGASSDGIAVSLGFGAGRVISGDIETMGIASHGISFVASHYAASHIGAGAPGGLLIDTKGGVIKTVGDGAAGIIGFSNINRLGTPGVPVDFDGTTTIRTGAINTSGAGAFGVAVASVDAAWNYPTGPAGSFDIQNLGAITASGLGSAGVIAATGSGTVSVRASANITASGLNGVGIGAASGEGLARVIVDSGVSVMGGWSLALLDRSSQSASSFYGVGRSRISFAVTSNLPAAGIVIYGGSSSLDPAAHIINNGLVGALNDRAITMGFPCPSVASAGPTGHPTKPTEPSLRQLISPASDFPTQPFQTLVQPAARAAPSTSCGEPVTPPVGKLLVENNGTVEGYVTFWDGASHQFDNSGVFNVRHFADTDGDGIRDTKRVSVSDFGAPGALFNNKPGGLVRFAPMLGAPHTDPTGYYLPTTGIDSRPLEASFYDLNRDGLVQGQFINVKTFDNAGTIDLRGPAVGNTLIITGGAGMVNGALQAGAGTFVSNGGRLLVNSVLNAGVQLGGQSNSYSDMLIVDSTVLGGGGATAISVANVGGTGAVTPGNGIEIVEVLNKATSAPGVFRLNGSYTTADGRPAVVGGAFAYTLFHNGIGGDVADGNWYLRSQLTPTDPQPTQPPDPQPTRPPDPQPTQPPDPQPTQPPDPQPTQPPDPQPPDPQPTQPPDPQPPDPQPTQPPNPQPTQPPKPLYQPRVPLTEAYPQMLGALNDMPTLQQRVGNRHWFEDRITSPTRTVFCKDPAKQFRCEITPAQSTFFADGTAKAAVIEGSAIWARVEGSRAHADPAVSTAAVRSDIDTWKVQLGVEALLHETTQGDKLIGGVTAHYGGAVASIFSPHGSGSIRAKGSGAGATLTWYGLNGFYADAQAHATWFKSDLSSDLVGPIVSGNSGFGYAMSLETGKRIRVGEAWAITPQAQLVYSSVDFDSFTDRFMAVSSLGRGDSLRGRIGVAADYLSAWRGAGGEVERLRLYGIANLYYQFLEGTRVEVAGTSFVNRNDRLVGELGLGATYNWADDKYSVYGEAAANSSLANFGTSYGYRGTAGFRMKW